MADDTGTDEVSFDWDDDHCYFEVEVILDELPAQLATELVERHGKDKLATWQSPEWHWQMTEWASDRDYLDDDDDRVDVLTEGVDVLDRHVHAEYGCPDCATANFDWFTGAIEEFIDDHLPTDVVVLDKHGDVHRPGELSFEILRDAAGAWGKDYRRVKATFDPAVPDQVTVRFDQGEITVVMFEPVAYRVLLAWADLTGGYDCDFTPVVPVVRQMTAAQVALVWALNGLDPILDPGTPGAPVYLDGTQARWSELEVAPAVDLLRAHGLWEADPAYLAQVASVLDAWAGRDHHVAEIAAVFAALAA